MSDKEKAKDVFSVFMKKQAQAKKRDAEIKSAVKKKPEKLDAKDQNKDKEAEGDVPAEEGMTEEEELEDAKKASRNKAAETNQTEMIKKMIIENIVKYVILISVLVIVAIGLIESGPAFFGAISGLIHEIFMSALGAK